MEMAPSFDVVGWFANKPRESSAALVQCSYAAMRLHRR
jgi:hypothetical protein